MLCAECGLPSPKYTPHVASSPHQWDGLHELPTLQHAEHDLGVARTGPQHASLTALHAGTAAHVPAGQFIKANTFLNALIALVIFCLLHIQPSWLTNYLDL